MINLSISYDELINLSVGNERGEKWKEITWKNIGVGV
jgi:hypothetical protein